ncbi:MAG: bifunctional metallophosphatase/5'-nucleotidase, partial [Spirochaetales bacterium]|nr:bifunctional metallophosphatase/5'-nucleotidase [Spirochaetales bacterium]
MNKKGLKTTVLVLLLFCLSLSFLASQPTIEIPSAQNLVILATTDLHGNVWGFSYEDDKDTTNNGMARIATYVEQVRREENNVVLVDNGDTIQGNIMTDDLYNKREAEHPIMRPMNLLEYDDMTLGNKEYNFGQKLISRIQALAHFPA